MSSAYNNLQKQKAKEAKRIIDGIPRPDCKGLTPDETFARVNEWWAGLTDGQKAHIRKCAVDKVNEIKRKKREFLAGNSK